MKPDEILDAAVAAVRDEPIDAATTRAALDRVARRLAADARQAAEPAAEEHRIRGCAGFQALLPAYREGALTPARHLLVEDHLRECVPCRRALRELERGHPPVATPAAAVPGCARRWALAATLAGVALGGAALWYALGGAQPDTSARVVTIEGELLVLDGGSARALAAGETLAEGRTVRTGAGARAVLALADGTQVELASRSELALGHRRDGAVLALDRGSLIVEAAPQRRGHLYVRTDDCLVAVVGTIFAVNHGAKGSRVSVLEGEVNVRQGDRRTVLRPGDQLATSDRLAAVPLEREVAWSRNAPAYRERLAALAALGRELDRVLAAPARRSSTRLLDAAPAGTAIYAALPNLSGRLAEAWATLEQRVAENPALAAWWQERFAGHDGAEIAAALDELRRFGDRLGDEIVVAMTLDAAGQPGAPVLLAEIADPRGFEELLDEEIARLDSDAGADADDGAGVRRVSTPAAAPADGRGLLVWRAGADLLVASPSALGLAAVERALAGEGFAGSPLYRRLADAYAGGVEWLLAVDAGGLIGAAPADPRERASLAALGIDGIDAFLLESSTEDTGTVHRARLTFRDERRGLASWLAEPAPSGALDFVSGDAALAVAGVLKRPDAMVDDLLAALGRGDGEALRHLAEAEAELGLSLRDDLAAALGGDFALAVDGPWLPAPAWKVVVEVADPGRLDHALGRLVEAANRHAERQGRPGLVWSQEAAADGLVFRRLADAGGRTLFEATVVDGYLVAAPSRALLHETLARRQAGATLLASPTFRERLPRDAEANFSALVWQNLGASAGDLAGLLAGAAGAPAEGMPALAAGPLLALAHAGPAEISLVAIGARGPLGLSLESLLTLGESLRAGSAPRAAPAAATRQRPAA